MYKQSSWQGAVRKYSRYFKPRECKVVAKVLGRLREQRRHVVGEGKDEKKERWSEDQSSEAEACLLLPLQGCLKH